MSASFPFCTDYQTLVCRVCVSALVTGALVWYIARHFSRTDDSTMAPPSESASNSEAGPSSKPFAASFGPSYAEALRSSPFFGSKFQYRMGYRYASVRVGRHQVPGEPQPAANAVFNTPELLAMIMAKLPMADARRAIAVSKLFRACLNPYAEYHLLGIKEALGLRFSRSIESLSASEKKQLQGQSCQHTKRQGPFAKWLFNISLDCKCLHGRYTPILKISPFTLASLTYDETSGVLEISLKLEPEKIEQDVSARARGVAMYRNGREILHYYRVSARHNWKDVKLVNMPFKVQVSVSVDFRKAMGAPSHTEGPCPVYGCHVGLCGVQVRLSISDIWCAVVVHVTD